MDRPPTEALAASALAKIKKELLKGTYMPAPVRTVEIPKPQGEGTHAGHSDGAGPTDSTSAASGAVTDLRT